MKVVLGVSGGIAAYKAPDLVRRLREAGAEVRVILTPNGARFVSRLALSAVSGHGVIVDQWGDPEKGGVDHIEIARWADALLIAPATANVIAKLAVGIADDALTTYAVAHRGMVIVAPAMNTFMLGHPTVQQNVEILRRRDVYILEPDQGLLACGDEGAGRMPDPLRIVEHVSSLFRPRDLTGRGILITAGPTREPIDPVRYLTNRSSGKMGYALAAAAQNRGAEVVLVTGPVNQAPPRGVTMVPVVTAEEMHAAVMAHLDGKDVLIKAAAVSDFTPEEPSPEKIRKDSRKELELRFRRTVDIAAEVARRDPRPFLVIFAAETSELEKRARAKLESKGADLVVANDVSDRSIGFDSDENEVTMFAPEADPIHVEKASKSAIANTILDRITEALGNTSGTRSAEAVGDAPARTPAV